MSTDSWPRSSTIRSNASGSTDDTSPKGYDGVRKFYADFVASGQGILQMRIEHLVVEDDRVAHDGVMTTIAPWQVARQRGSRSPKTPVIT